VLTRITDMLMNLLYCMQIDLQLIHMSGVYTTKDLILPKIVAFTLVIVYMVVFSQSATGYMCFSFIAAIFMNGVELYFDQQRELLSFNSLMKVDKNSTNLSQFINRLLPLHVQDIVNKGIKTGELYQNVTLLFADIVGFTAYSAGKKPRQVVQMLSSLFTNFDKECDRLNLFKLYTIGDCYVVMGFVDSKNRRKTHEEAHAVAQLAISMISIISNVRKKIRFDALNMRIGIHTGDVYGGVIGTELIRFDLYGEDVVLANKMESNGQPGNICVSETTRSLLEQVEMANYTFTDNQVIHLKSSDRKVNSYFMNLDQFIKNNKDDLDGELGEIHSPS
jgi:class 3 adenylate cyclase